ncbi:MAG: CCA tRNA nucleotidyltransferase [Methanobacteriaceae archaeon]
MDLDYQDILKDFKPTEAENKKVRDLANRLIEALDNIAKRENIDCKAKLVGSVAKGTWLLGKADIDIFIQFSLDVKMAELKKYGLYLGYEVFSKFNGFAEEHYASHPYVSGAIECYDVDIVPCYDIKDAKHLKSAVDRTILHTNYIKTNIKPSQINEVLLLKKFMETVGTYGSEFKTGGFAGYLCEIMILKYGNFENTLNEVANKWKEGTVLDIENFKTSLSFKDPLIAIDPIDKNRNVAASLILKKLGEFVIASRNFLENPKKEYFYGKNMVSTIYTDLINNIMSKFKDRETKTLCLSFKVPELSPDSLHPQIKKTENSLRDKLECAGFNIINSTYWTNESDIGIIIFEAEDNKLAKYKIHQGPKIWDKSNSERFLEKNAKNLINTGNNAYIRNSQWVYNKKRRNRTPEELIKFIISKENIHHLKAGKNIKASLLNTYALNNILEVLNNDIIRDFERLDTLLDEKSLNEFIEELDYFLNPMKYLKY